MGRSCSHPASLRRVLLVALLAVSWIGGTAALLDYTRVHLVDHDAATNNFLFRGNMPVDANHSFAYDLLVSYLGKRAAEHGVTLPSPANFSLVDISLNNDFDGQDFKAEKAFWKDPASASKGRFINWPLGIAGVLPPSLYPASKVKAMANSSVWKVDQIPERIAVVRTTLLQKAPRPTVQYVHCTAGCDRTGEFVGSYRMQYHAENVTLMYSQDTAECGRSPNYWSTTALEWFCWRMFYNGETNVGSCNSFAKCKFAGKCTPTPPS